MKRSSITLEDVARHANVSQATASRALRGDARGLVKEENLRRVLAAAAELNYRHKAFASSRLCEKSNTIALVVSDIDTPVFWRKVNAASRVLRDAGYTVVHYDCGSSLQTEQETLKKLRRSEVDGVLIACYLRPASCSFVPEFQRHGFPTVSLEPMTEVECDTVTVDRRYGVRIVVDYLVSHGHRSIAFLGPRQHTGAERHPLWNGYEEAVAAHGLPFREEWTASLDGPMAIHGAYEGASRMLGLPDRPTALFATDDEAAIGLLRACQERSLAVPGDVAIVGFDDLPMAAFLPVPLTTVANPAEQCGEQAAHVLLGRLDGETGPVRCIALEPALVVRRSA